MKKTLNVQLDRPGLWMDGNVTFGQVGHWFGHTTQDLKMDVIYPQESVKEKWPCIVWICGGGWVQMDHHAHVPNFVELAREGYVIASVQYRDSNQTPFPGQLEDVKKAIRYLKAHADRYHIDTERFGVMGESAGGHLSSLVGTTGDRAEFDTGEYLSLSSAVQATCSWYVPSNFASMRPSEDPEVLIQKGLSPEARLLNEVSRGATDKVKQASPITYINSNTTPFLLIHGIEDVVVPHDQSVELYDALEAQDIPVDLISIEGANHADQHFFQTVVMDEIVDFFDKYLK